MNPRLNLPIANWQSYTGEKAGVFSGILGDIRNEKHLLYVVSPYSNGEMMGYFKGITDTVFITSNYEKHRSDLRKMFLKVYTKNAKARKQKFYYSIGKWVPLVIILLLISLPILMMYETEWSSHLYDILAQVTEQSFFYMVTFYVTSLVILYMISTTFSKKLEGVREEKYIYKSNDTAIAVFPDQGEVMDNAKQEDNKYPFIHSKIILTSKRVYIGSANFSTAGMIFNVETISWTDDAMVRKGIKRYIEGLLEFEQLDLRTVFD